MIDETRPGSNPRIHSTPTETRERTYERAREGGIRPDVARKIADDVTRTVHETNDRRDR